MQEGHGAFQEVLAVAEDALRVALEVELLVERIVVGRGEHPAQVGEGQRGAGGEAGRDGHGLVHERVVVDAAPDQSPLGRPLGRDRLAQHAHAQGAGAPDRALQVEAGGAIRDDPQLRNEDELEARRARGERDVGVERDSDAAAGGGSVDRRHRRLVEVKEVPDERVEEFLHALGHHLSQREVGRHASPAQVGPGAEPAPGAGEDEGARRRVLRHLREPRSYLADERLVQAVEHLRSVEPEQCDPVADLEFDQVIGHLSHPALAAVSSRGDSPDRATGQGWSHGSTGPHGSESVGRAKSRSSVFDGTFRSAFHELEGIATRFTRRSHSHRWPKSTRPWDRTGQDHPPMALYHESQNARGRAASRRRNACRSAPYRTEKFRSPYSTVPGLRGGRIS